MTGLLGMWQLYAVIAMGALVYLQVGATLGYHAGVVTYYENGADALPLLVAEAAYPWSGEACHAAAVAEITGIADAVGAADRMGRADAIGANAAAGDVDGGRAHRTAWHGDAALAKEAYYDELDARGVKLMGHGVFTDMEVAVDAWLDGRHGAGPATPGC